MEIERVTRIEKTVDADLTVPLNKKEIEMSDESCFGRMWDMTSKECPQCADRDVCAILFKDSVDIRGKQIEEDLGSKFLSDADFENLTSDNLIDKVTSGVTTSSELIQIGMEVSNCSEVKGVTNRIKYLIQTDKKIKIENKLVWVL